MTNLTTLDIEKRGAAAWVWMDRADKHNAFDETLIAELTGVIRALNTDEDCRVIVLGGRGKSFSAGADLNWMKRQGAAGFEANVEDAGKLADLFHALGTSAKPTLARVQGAAMGGGMGLAAACDICVASTEASFATSEVKLGIIPAVISPYVVRAIGARQSARYFQTAERISAARAYEIGLAHEVVPADELDAKVDSVVKALLSGGPQAQAAAKDLIHLVDGQPLTAEIISATAHRIAQLRSTREAAEGLSAFLEKRAPSWMEG